MNDTKPLSPITFVRVRHNDLWCRVCGNRTTLDMPISCEDLVRAIRRFDRAHAKCRKMVARNDSEPVPSDCQRPPVCPKCKGAGTVPITYDDPPDADVKTCDCRKEGSNS